MEKAAKRASALAARPLGVRCRTPASLQNFDPCSRRYRLDSRMAGLLTRPNRRAFPALRQWQVAATFQRTHSSGYCAGFAPASLFIRGVRHPAPFLGAKLAYFSELQPAGAENFSAPRPAYRIFLCRGAFRRFLCSPPAGICRPRRLTCRIPRPRSQPELSRPRHLSNFLSLPHPGRPAARTKMTAARRPEGRTVFSARTPSGRHTAATDSEVCPESARGALPYYFFCSFSKSRISVSSSSSFEGAGSGAGAAGASTFFFIKRFISLTIIKTQSARIVKSTHCWMKAP